MGMSGPNRRAKRSLEAVDRRACITHFYRHKEGDMPGIFDRLKVRRQDRKARRRKQHAVRHVRNAHKLAADAQARRSDTEARGGGGIIGGGGSVGGF